MTLHILIHNVGHGQAIHAFTPSGHVVAIDLGCSSDFSPLAWLRSKTQTIDKLIITHPHGDHIDEVLDLQSHGFHVRQLWRPKWLTAEEVHASNQTSYRDRVDRYLQMSDLYSSPIAEGELIGNPEVTGGVKISEFASTGCGRGNINNHSGVVIFAYLGIKVIIPGDNEPPSWNELLSKPEFLSSAKNADILMASHHGRQSGYLSDLFDAEAGLGKPRLCAISDGRVQDTDASARYSYHAQGWEVHSREGRKSEQRYCVTTRTDSFIDIRIGKSGTTGGSFLEVKVD